MKKILLLLPLYLWSCEDDINPCQNLELKSLYNTSSITVLTVINSTSCDISIRELQTKEPWISNQEYQGFIENSTTDGRSIIVIPPNCTISIIKPDMQTGSNSQEPSIFNYISDFNYDGNSCSGTGAGYNPYTNVLTL